MSTFPYFKNILRTFHWLYGVPQSKCLLNLNWWMTKTVKWMSYSYFYLFDRNLSIFVFSLEWWISRLMLVLFLLLISRLINRSGLRICHSKVSALGIFLFYNLPQQLAKSVMHTFLTQFTSLANISGQEYFRIAMAHSFNKHYFDFIY